MKYFLIGLILLIIFGCKYQAIETADNPVKAIITGQDMRDCMCCDGWMIKIDSSVYDFNKVPQGCTINLDSAKFPLNVYISWIKDTISCGNKIILKKLLIRQYL